MHLNHPRPDLGEVIAPEEEKERQGAHREDQRDRDEGAATGDHLFKQRTVALTEFVETAFEPLLKADEHVPRWFRAGLPVLLMWLGHGDSSSYISPWSAPACARG